MDKADKISLLDLFLVMAKIGAFTIGGGYAMLLMIQKEVTSRGWISDEEFPDLIALSQAAPGLLAVNISIFTGYKLRGIPGAAIATIGSCLPPFLIILLIALCFSNYAENEVVQRVFAGMRPAVVALIAVPMIKMVRNSCRKWWQYAVTAVALILVSFLKVSPIYILMVVVVISLSLSIALQKK